MPQTNPSLCGRGTHWWAYKEGDKHCLQSLKPAQLAQEGGLPVLPDSLSPAGATQGPRSWDFSWAGMQARQGG